MDDANVLLGAVREALSRKSGSVGKQRMLVKRTFASFDADGSGVVDPDEFHRALEQYVSLPALPHSC